MFPPLMLRMMNRQCDVCGARVPRDERFCLTCGLELVDEPAAAAFPPEPPSAEPPEGDYVLAARDPEPDMVHVRLERAAGLLREGRLAECGELLRTCRAGSSRDRTARAACSRLAAELKEAKGRVLKQARTLERTPGQLVAWLRGPAANQLTTDELAELAVRSAETLGQSGDTEHARRLLQLSVFRQVRDERLLARHREVDQHIWRQHERQERIRNVGVFAVAIPLSLVLLVFWVKLLMALPGRLSVLVSLAALGVLLFGVQPLRRWLHRKVEGKGAQEVDN